MALVQKRDTKKTVMTFVVLGAVVVGGVVALILYLPKSSSTTTDVGTGVVSSGRDLPTYTKFSEDVYTSDQFKQLRNYLDGVPALTNANTDTGGNPNPFRVQ